MTPGESLLGGGRLSWSEARQPPCLDCRESYCCTHVVVSEFSLHSIIDVDYALYLLAHDGLLIGLDRDMQAKVFLYQPCSHLDQESGLCTVHSTPLQPATCRNYPAHSCVYRIRMVDGIHPDAPLLDLSRMRWLAERLVFDEKRLLVGAPDWDQVLDAFASMPLERRPAPVPGPDPVLEEWRSIVLTSKDPSPPLEPHRYHDAAVTNPCSGCAAYCCTTLIFGRPAPTDMSGLEWLRYCLGFPSVELGISEDGWALIVHSTCRHLAGGLCSLYGSDDRPLRCSHYDALECDYRAQFATPRPEEIVRVSREQFVLLQRMVVFDELGRIQAVAPVDVIRDVLEEAERGRARAVAG